MDHHVPGPVTKGLKLRRIDVLTAEEDGAKRHIDSLLMERATSLNRVLVSMDDDLLVEAARRHEQRMDFSGLVYAHQLRVDIGGFIRDLVELCQAREPGQMVNQVIYLPIR
jgi:hypothetical protein